MEDDNYSSTIMTPDSARELLLDREKGLGYESLEKVPMGRGNDYLTALKLIANGELGESVEIDQAIKKAREQNAQAEERERIRNYFEQVDEDERWQT